MHAVTVLVVDDDDGVRDALHDLLEPRGYRVVDATNGRDGLVVLRAVQIDLVVLDLSMPEMDGWQFLDHRSTEASLAAVPVIVAAATPDQAAEVDPRIQQVLWKPFTGTAMANAVQRWAPTRAPVRLP
jgi:CheY-like chemotaxis protein